ncbi:hypothetical protein Pst134EA_009796 [Puccinia striiformis f. sp. tritici]|uniref:hypothetical protein n=1 Tax=Puccinia striiformis f. sp. tritici TaxID=168172 RepID=UPI002008880C|nr:hypothetical protein Pst134EA_009796 [Puccinia striiformis f. sp. tritici]KAH9469275.1 hypothetical protein Pst134EA_009796 [Puccinia striiformis f. sp. tritici]
MGMSSIRQSTPPNQVQAVLSPHQSAESSHSSSLAPRIYSNSHRLTKGILAPALSRSTSSGIDLVRLCDLKVLQVGLKVLQQILAFPTRQPAVVNLEQDSDDEN